MNFFLVYSDKTAYKKPMQRGLVKGTISHIQNKAATKEYTIPVVKLH